MPGELSAAVPPLSQVVTTLGTRWEEREVRGKKSPDGGVVLYKKWKATGSAANHEARVQKRVDAREYVEKAIVSEFAKRKGAFGDYAQDYIDLMKADLRWSREGGFKMKELTRLNQRIVSADAVMVAFTKARAEVNRPSAIEKLPPDRALETLLATPGFRGEMNIEEGMKLYVELAKKLPLSSSPDYLAARQTLDALNQWIDDGAGKAEAGKRREMAGERIKAAASGGSQHLQTSAQHAELPRIGTPVGKTGLCARLCPLVALAESQAPDGDNPVLTRLARESSRAPLPGPVPFAVHVEGLSANATFMLGCPAAKVPRTSGEGGELVDLPTTKCSELADSLTSSPAYVRDRAAFRGLEVGGHVMMVGVVQKPGGENRFVFYDPDAGLARFDSKEKLASYLDKYFGQQGYGERHGVTKHEGEYAFTSIKDYDIGVLRTVVPAPSSAVKFADWVPPSLDRLLSPEPG